MHTRIGAFCIILSGLLVVMGCVTTTPQVEVSTVKMESPLVTIQHIDSFKPEVACAQALEVINNNPYEQEFFEKVFGRILEQCENSKSPDNADIIWEHFVAPLTKSGRVPPDLAKTTWNYCFARQFVSLPDTAMVVHFCDQLSEIKQNIEKEYRLKKTGFEICKQGSPESHFLNAMYVYNTMWAACHNAEE